MMLYATRRRMMQASIGTAIGLAGFSTSPLSARSTVMASREKLPVAAVVTVYRKNSHADVIIGKILEGYLQDGGPGPSLQVATLYTDQVPDSDLSRALEAKHGFRIVKTIDEALTLGTNQLQVAGVLSIGEHGDYPRTADTGQKMYPRRRFFDEIVACFRRCDQVVPVFNDKHLSWKWDDAVAMVRTAREMQFPLLAGSSLPVAWREPPVELPAESVVESAVSIGYGGIEDYGFHALEMHQCMLERRRGGESGVKAVQTVTADDVRQLVMDGSPLEPAFRAALRMLPGVREDPENWRPGKRSAAFLLQHADGLNSAVVMADGLAAGFAFAAKLRGDEQLPATWFRLQEVPPFGHFAYLLDAIDETIHAGRTMYPVERTLLTTGILDRAMHSMANDGQRYSTPELAIPYQPAEWPYANHPQPRLDLPFE